MKLRIVIAFGILSGCGSGLNWHAGSGGSTSSSSSGGGGSTSSSSGGGGDQAATWKRMSIKDIVIGSDFDKVPGFTCGPDPASQGFSTYRHTCVKFLDARCEGRPSKIHHIRSSADVPQGQSCFHDEGSTGTYLDRKLMSPPLSAITIVATDTHHQRVYEIRYTFAKDVLTEDSNLGKALIAKLGRPTNLNPPVQMAWQVGDTLLDAECGMTQGPAGEFCMMQVSDSSVLDLERSKDKAADEEAAKKNAPPAPTL